MADMRALIQDLRAEGDDLDTLLINIADWDVSTPAPGWSIAHQIAHLAWTDEIAILSATDPDRFRAEVTAALPRMATYVDEAAVAGAQEPRDALLKRWRAGREGLATALAAVDPVVRLPWLGPPMSPASMATARLMETWAHGQDVADAVGYRRYPTDRLRHVAHLGVRTRDFAYLLNDMVPPDGEFRVELTGPSGEPWTWGAAGGTERVSGPALDFCLLVTQRRHQDDLNLQAEGEEAARWLAIAQVFAGPPGGGRAAGQFGPGEGETA